MTWSLGQDGALTISGKGDMKNYTYKSEMPWYKYISKIKSVVIKEGVTSIGDYAFYGMTGMTKITIPKGITSIGAYAFKNSTALDGVQLPITLKKLGESSLAAVVYVKLQFQKVFIPFVDILLKIVQNWKK